MPIPENLDYEYRVMEWRNAEREGVEGKKTALLAIGWEVTGPVRVKAGMTVDLYMQSYRRPKK